MFATERPIGVGEVFPFLAEHGGIPDNTDPIVHWSRVRTHIAKRYAPDIIATSGKVAPRNMHSDFWRLIVQLILPRKSSLLE